MDRLGFLIGVALLAGCAFGSMPDTHSKQFWIDKDERMSRW